MTLEELLAHTRSRILRDSAGRKLWTDDEIVAYLNEAQEQFARRTHILADDTSDFTFVTTTADVAVYTLDPRVVFVAEVRGPDFLMRQRPRRFTQNRWGTGRPCYYTMDAAHRVMRLTPTPDAAYELDLLVARKPAERMSLDVTNSAPEIDEDYHLALCDWAAYRALRNNDPDGGAMAPADTFRAAWEMAVRDAKRDVFRLRHSASPQATNNWTGKTR